MLVYQCVSDIDTVEDCCSCAKILFCPLQMKIGFSSLLFSAFLFTSLDVVLLVFLVTLVSASNPALSCFHTFQNGWNALVSK